MQAETRLKSTPNGHEQYSALNAVGYWHQSILSVSGNQPPSRMREHVRITGEALVSGRRTCAKSADRVGNRCRTSSSSPAAHRS